MLVTVSGSGRERGGMAEEEGAVSGMAEGWASEVEEGMLRGRVCGWADREEEEEESEERDEEEDEEEVIGIATGMDIAIAE